MRIEFDPTKDAVNHEKHGYSLSLAGELDWETAWVWVDDRFNYQETRLVALVLQGDMLFYVAYVERNDVRRIISLRRANRREVKHYVKHIETP